MFKEERCRLAVDDIVRHEGQLHEAPCSPAGGNAPPVDRCGQPRSSANPAPKAACAGPAGCAPRRPARACHRTGRGCVNRVEIFRTTSSVSARISAAVSAATTSPWFCISTIRGSPLCARAVRLQLLLHELCQAVAGISVGHPEGLVAKELPGRLLRIARCRSGR